MRLQNTNQMKSESWLGTTLKYLALSLTMVVGNEALVRHCVASPSGASISSEPAEVTSAADATVTIDAQEGEVANPTTATNKDSQAWPMWRYSAGRSASSPNNVPLNPQLAWKRSFGKRLPVWDDPLNQDLMSYDHQFEPVVENGMLFVGFNDQDKVIGIDLTSGETRWTFFGEGPFRLPLVVKHGQVYATCDDGHLYCINATNGELNWKFLGAPNTQKILGNRRLISAWPARGGAVIEDGIVYFANSIWPFMGTFIYALDSQTGELKWVNDSTGAQYIKQPHSAPAFAGVAPQGAFVISGDNLIVPGGRSVPALFDKSNGSFKYFELNAGGKGNGGAFVAADDLHFYVHTRLKGTRAFDLKKGLKTAFTPDEPVIDNSILYSSRVIDGEPKVQAFLANLDSEKDREAIWTFSADATRDLIGAGNHLVACGQKSITVIEKPTRLDNTLDGGKIVAEIPCEYEISRVVCADNSLIVVTDAGDLIVYRNDPEVNAVQASGDSKLVDRPDVAAPFSDDDRGTNSVKQTIASEPQADWVMQCWNEDHADGYALWFGNATDSELATIAKLSDRFEEFAIITDDTSWCTEARAKLDSLGVYGKVTVRVGTPKSFRAPQYIASSIVVNDLQYVSPDKSDEFAAIYQSLRPYGGRLIVRTEAYLNTTASKAESEAENETPDLESDKQANLRHVQALAIDHLKLEQAQVGMTDFGVSVHRVGALPGSADWTHQYGDVGNTIKSNDSRVKLPLGVLWFGASSNMDVLPRHGHGPSQQVVAGRLFIQGMNSLSARDVYTGRVLWKREFEDLGTFDIYYDATYEDTPLDPKYNQVHIPGANGRGTNYIVTEDCIYLIVANECLLIDPASGKDLGKISMPADENGNTPEWGYIGVYKDILFGGVGFANYKSKYDLQIESDEGLSASKAGFGSKSLDRAASRGLIAFDRKTGELLWKIDANHSFWHNGIVAGNDRLYLLDRYPATIEDALKRRGKKLPNTYRIAALNYKTGEKCWELNDHIFGTWLGYSEKHDVLLQAGSKASDRLKDEVGVGMRVYRGETGELIWAKDKLSYAGPCILHNETIITNANAYAESAGAFDLLTGKQKLTRNPISGLMEPWKIVRAYGCNNIIASEHLLTFRSGAAGYLDLETDGGTGNLGGFKSGCTSNLIVANGVLNAPDYTRTCSCAYQNQTSIAMVHMPEIDQWSVHPATNLIPPGTPIETLSINFGAPGDRRDQDGQLWIEHPAQAGDHSPISIETNSDVRYFQQHSSSVSGSSAAWIFASGATNLTNLKVGLRAVTVEKPKSDSDKSDGDKKDSSEEETLPVEQNHIGRYRIRIFIGLPRQESHAKFDLWMQGELRKSGIQLSADSDKDNSSSDNTSADNSRIELTFEDVELNGHLDLKLVPVEGKTVLNGVQLIGHSQNQ